MTPGNADTLCFNIPRLEVHVLIGMLWLPACACSVETSQLDSQSEPCMRHPSPRVVLVSVLLVTDLLDNSGRRRGDGLTFESWETGAWRSDGRHESATDRPPQRTVQIHPNRGPGRSPFRTTPRPQGPRTLTHVKRRTGEKKTEGLPATTRKKVQGTRRETPRPTQIATELPES